VIYFKKGNGNQVRKEAPITGLIPMFIFALLIIFIGVYPNFIIKILNSAAFRAS